MRIESRELNELWKRMDSHMNDNHFREELRLASYSDMHHKKLFDLITQEAQTHALPPQQEMKPLLESLYKSLKQVIGRESEAVIRFQEKENHDLGSVLTLFEKFPNPQVVSLREKHNRNAAPSKSIVKQCSEDMHLIEFIMADPRLQQVQNPALTGRALSF